MNRVLKVRVLGCGCSTGVPRIDGYWGACDPSNPKNRRTRCSAWFGVCDGDRMTSVAVDTAPEFREQMVRAGVHRLDAVLWTHDHADQVHGIDDMRAYTFAAHQMIDGYMDIATRETLRARFGYIFEGKMGYPPVCREHLIPPHGTPWQVEGEGGALPILTFDQEHGPIRSIGYRIGNVAYSSDMSHIPESSYPALQGLDLWIVDAMRRKPHPTHSHLEATLELIARLRPRRAVLTNLHQEMDYEALKAELPAGVEPAYDQMEFSFDFP